MSLIAGAGAMGGTSCLRCYVLDGARHQGRPAWEALLQHASRIGISGGSVFTAMAGFGH